MKKTFLFAYVILVIVALLFTWQPQTASSESALTTSSPFCLTMIEAGVHHLGDETVDYWEAPNPEGVSWTKNFDLPYADGPILLRLETFDVNEAGTNVRVNGQRLMSLSGKTGETWQFQAVVIEQQALLAQGNKIRIEVGGGSNKDDILFRNIGVVICYTYIEANARYIGDTPTDYWLIPIPEDILLRKNFVIGDELPNVAMISFDIFDNQYPGSIILNGQTVGTLSSSSSPEVWERQTVIIDGQVLVAGTNTLTVIPGNFSGKDGPWDDIIIKNIRIFYETRPTSVSNLPMIVR